MIKYYAPGHISSSILDYKKRMNYLSVTYLTYNQNGTELLVNLSGEQIYLFDVNNTFQFKYDDYKTIFKDLERTLFSFLIIHLHYLINYLFLAKEEKNDFKK
jgi:hypothetical protein